MIGLGSSENLKFELELFFRVDGLESYLSRWDRSNSKVRRFRRIGYVLSSFRRLGDSPLSQSQDVSKKQIALDQVVATTDGRPCVEIEGRLRAILLKGARIWLRTH
jgi:hypothetical protein